MTLILDWICKLVSQQKIKEIMRDYVHAIVRFAIETGMKIDDPAGEMEVFLRWAKLKAQYQASKKG
jgi:hypothetical protein